MTEELVEQIVLVRGRELSVLRPRTPERLIDEERFGDDEYIAYWAELWPSGLALARVLEGRSLHGARVLELGCGLAIPSIVAALNGGRVLATDWAPEAIRVATMNAARNGATLTAAIVDWRRPERLLAERPWQLVLAADVLYERRNVDALLELLPRLVDARSEVLVADPGRRFAATFLAAADDDWQIASAPDREQPSVRLHRLRKRV